MAIYYDESRDEWLDEEPTYCVQCGAPCPNWCSTCDSCFQAWKDEQEAKRRDPLAEQGDTQ